MKKIIAGFLPSILAIILLAVLFLIVQADSAQANPSELHIITFETGKQPTFSIHVAVTGHDDTGNGTPGNPYASLERAAQEIAPGGAILLHTGTYTGGSYLEDLEGTEAAPIWIGGVEGETRPVIEGGGEGIHLVRARYVIVHDLEVRITDDNGINSDDGGDYANAEAAQYQIFRNLYIHHVGGTGNQDCLKLSGVNNYFVLDSEFAFCGGGGSGSGIDHVGCHQGLIAGNFLHNMNMSANAIQVKGGSEDILIYANDLWNCGERALNIGGSTDFAYFRPPLSTTQPNYEARNIRVIANVFDGSVTPLAFVGAVDSLAVNNTLVNPTNWLMRILQETTTSGDYEFMACGNNTVVNNLFYFNRADLSTEDINIGADTAPDTFTFSNNLWYAHDDPAQSQPDLPVVETDGIVGVDPLLVNPSTGNFHLQESSPASGSGIALAGVEYDYEGIQYNDPPSIGAFEGNPPVALNQIFLPVVQR
jgi:hypothetical protein